MVPPFSICNIPSSICEDIRKEASTLLSKSNHIVAGPFGSNIFTVSNTAKPKSPYLINYDISKRIVSCDPSICVRYRAFEICSHTVAIAFKLEIFQPYIAKNDKRCAKGLVSKVANSQKNKNAGKKRSKATQRRKGPANKKPTRVETLVDPADGANINNGNNVNSVQIDTTNILLQNPMQNQHHPYHITLLMFCHPNVSVCYGCSGKFNATGYPAPPFDLIVVSKAHREYFDVNKHQMVCSPNLSNVYYHFNLTCIFTRDPSFQLSSVHIPDELKQSLKPEHIMVLMQNGLTI